MFEAKKEVSLKAKYVCRLVELEGGEGCRSDQVPEGIVRTVDWLAPRRTQGSKKVTGYWLSNAICYL